MLELSEERLKKDEIEVEYFGFCSTDVYITYREFIDVKLKKLMVQVATYYDKKEKDSETINKMLFDQYKAFWIAVEPTLQKFYENIQKALAIPESYMPKRVNSPQDIIFDPDIKKIEKEIQILEERYLEEKCYLRSLQHRKEVIEKNCQTLKSRNDLVSKLFKDNEKKLGQFKILDEKRVEKMNKLIDGFDKVSMMRSQW